MALRLSPRPGKEPVMIRASMIRASVPIACLVVAVFALSPAAVAEPGPETPPPIDWRDFVDHDVPGCGRAAAPIACRPHRWAYVRIAPGTGESGLKTILGQ